ncbi:BrnT family toxin [Lichenibacterium ramalinae]|uniref:BrnT family toxin n=1 Tax=Lichenibacterium ramalinae TaxID=2316527 RepID=A0A4Q2RBD8_9HYPH|nr:BrnT family toxin [Lichenibacterium ramalinae]RYB04177.1 BrnT family toxin [Lichenibacterium ramalinae]
MAITFDPRKRDDTLLDRGLDFDTAVEVFENGTVDIPDRRRDYGEERVISVGFLRDRMVIVVWTQRGEARHVISMRKANGREQERYSARFGTDRRPRDLGPGI